MKKVFEVTDHGLIVDKRNILPESILVLGSNPPSHWQRFGRLHDLAVDDQDRELVIATPEGAVTGDTQPELTREAIGEMDKEAVVEILQAHSVDFDGRAGVDTLRELAIKTVFVDL